MPFRGSVGRSKTFRGRAVGSKQRQEVIMMRGRGKEDMRKVAYLFVVLDK